MYRASTFDLLMASISAQVLNETDDEGFTPKQLATTLQRVEILRIFHSFLERCSRSNAEEVSSSHCCPKRRERERTNTESHTVQDKKIHKNSHRHRRLRKRVGVYFFEEIGSPKGVVLSCDLMLEYNEGLASLPNNNK